MSIDKPRTQKGLLHSEAAVPKVELARLQTIERAHASFQKALLTIQAGSADIRREAGTGLPYAQGWVAAYRLFMTTIAGGEE